MEIKDFKQMLTEHKCVNVKFEPSCDGNNPSEYHYEMNADGNIFECYDYNRTYYRICNINDNQAMADNFLLSLRHAISIVPGTASFV